MGAPDKKLAPEIAASTAEEKEIVETYSLDKLSPEKRHEITQYFKNKDKAEKLSANANNRAALKSKVAAAMPELARKNAATPEIIASILKATVEANRDADISGKYADDFWNEYRRESVDVEGNDDDAKNPVYAQALANLQNMIRRTVAAQEQGGKFVKAEHVDTYAQAAIADYVKKMDSKAETLGWGVLRIAELSEKGMQPLSFAEWMKGPDAPRPEELYMELDLTEAQAYVQQSSGLQDALTKLEEGRESMSPAMYQFFTAKIEEAKAKQAGNPAEALEIAQKSLQGMAAVKAIVATRTAIEASAKQVEEMKGKLGEGEGEIVAGYAKLQEDIKAAIEAYKTDNDAEKLTKAQQAVEKTQQELGTKMEPFTKKAEEEKAAGEKAKTAAQEAQDIMNDPKKLLEKLLDPEGKKGWLSQILVTLAVSFGLDGWLTKMMGKFQEMTPTHKQAVTLLKKQDFSLAGAKNILSSYKTVGAALEAKDLPEKVEAPAFAQFQADLRANDGETEEAKKTPLSKFLADHAKNWKKGEAEASAPAAVAGGEGAAGDAGVAPEGTEAGTAPVAAAPAATAPVVPVAAETPPPSAAAPAAAAAAPEAKKDDDKPKTA